MLPERLDMLLAFKAIALSRRLTATDTRVAAVIIDHFNHGNGRCDPGLPRIARLAGCSERAAARSVERLHKADLIFRTRHGGYSGRNSYQPNWMHLRELDEQWQAQCRAANVARDMTRLAPGTGQSCQVGADSPVTQTCLENLSNEPVSPGATARPVSQAAVQAEGPKALERRTRVERRSAARTPSSHDVANQAARRRWDSALLERCAGVAGLYERAADQVTNVLAERATELELGKRGAGIRFIAEELGKLGIDVPQRRGGDHG